MPKIKYTDADNDALKLADNVELVLGDGSDRNDPTSGDFKLAWDGTNLSLTPTTAGSVFKPAAGTVFSLGAQANTTGSGTALSSTVTSALRAYGDDGEAAVASSVFMRTGVFRTLLTYTAGNREQEAAGVVGQLVSKSGTNRHNMCGLMGSYEVNTALTVDGQAYSTDTWAQAAVIGRVGAGSAITTINSNGVLAGFAAMSNTTSFVANNGIFAAYYAGRWGGTGLARWTHGLYCEDVEQAGYFNVNAGTITGEKHGWSMINTGTLSSGDSLVGANIVTTAAGSAASWVSGLYVKATQASKVVNGYLCAAEFELTSVAANASDNSVIVLNSTSNHTGSPPACTPYITLREYGTTPANVLFRVFGDSGQTGTLSATTMATTAGAAFEANCDYAFRVMVGSTPYWLLASSTAPS